ncbi:hypothetical protein AJ79_05720 [Helicocarpus griseus UAMH5409]|uniref:ATP-dependent RNA helicase n=1 Tax=Helicocarpus griseus UAMH5409 TaxID=1447875 RepID=A0A2B7XK94_9EURO|nr:hypothetical protein AJ79_05720 [Helicocarpus griseus UAMH5409]
MLSSVRRGNVLARTLRTCIARPARIQAGIQQPIQTCRIAQQPFTLPTRAFHECRVAKSFAASAVKEVDDLPSTPYADFSELASNGLVNEKVINVITDEMNITTMTDVQRLTINTTLSGTDILAQAKTGTGKTLAFLVPIVQNILRDESLARKPKYVQRSVASDIRAIIMSPTRELAEQIAVEARKVVSQTGVIVQTAVGGTHKREGLQRIQREGCHILVGTPGRLIDIFSDRRTGVAAPKLSAFVLDEADRLLDQGFAPEIERFLRYLPERSEMDRQTLMFSATVPREVMAMVRKTMKPDFTFVKTVKEDEIPTHLTVPQKAVELFGLENQLPALLELVQQYNQKRENDPANNRPFKAIVYFNSTAEVALARQAFQNMRGDEGHPLPNTEILEIHSRLSQAQRTLASNTFRQAQSGILFSSDVTARGMDFPDVTHVIQIGPPRDRETYVHRLGRTARANKTGEGWLFYTEPDRRNLRRNLWEIPIEVDNSSLVTASADMAADDHTPVVSEIISLVKNGFLSAHMKAKFAAYSALLGSLTSWDDKYGVVDAVNRLSAHAWCMRHPPAFDKRTAARLGYVGIPGLNTSNRPKWSSDTDSSVSPRGSGSRGPSPFGASRSSFGRRSNSSSKSQVRKNNPFEY